MLLVEGYAGIGKTALIQQLMRPIVRQRGYFISGKFDQVARGVPFGALIQAFRGLVQQWLTESEAQLAAWRDTLAAALGGNGGVLAEVIPEIEFIVGPQADAGRRWAAPRRRTASSACCTTSSPRSHSRGTRWCCSSTTCNGPMPRRWRCWSRCWPAATAQACC